MEPFTAFDPERTAVTDDVYAALGRALTLATRYESNCRALAIAGGMRASPEARRRIESATSDEIEEILEEFAGRTLNDYIKAVAKYGEFDKGFVCNLHSARKSRNEIAHEITRGLDDGVDPTNAILSARLRDIVVTIASADFFVACLLDMMNGTAPPKGGAPDALSAYVDRMVKWVFTPSEMI